MYLGRGNLNNQSGKGKGKGKVRMAGGKGGGKPNALENAAAQKGSPLKVDEKQLEAVDQMDLADMRSLAKGYGGKNFTIADERGMRADGYSRDDIKQVAATLFGAGDTLSGGAKIRADLANEANFGDLKNFDPGVVGKGTYDISKPELRELFQNNKAADVASMISTRGLSLHPDAQKMLDRRENRIANEALKDPAAQDFANSKIKEINPNAVTTDITDDGKSPMLDTNPDRISQSIASPAIRGRIDQRQNAELTQELGNNKFNNNLYDARIGGDNYGKIIQGLDNSLIINDGQIKQGQTAGIGTGGMNTGGSSGIDDSWAAGAGMSHQAITELGRHGIQRDMVMNDLLGYDPMGGAVNTIKTAERVMDTPGRLAEERARTDLDPYNMETKATLANIKAMGDLGAMPAPDYVNAYAPKPPKEYDYKDMISAGMGMIK